MAATRDTIHPGAPTTDERCDRLLAGRYRFVRLLGEGGTGRVYLARDQGLSRHVAVKAIRPSLCDSPEVRGRIERECRLHAAIGVHPNIVALHDRVDEDGQIHLVMEYVPGQTLAGLLAARAGGSPLPAAMIIGIAGQLLEALACIHAHGIIHRDIKTSNLMVCTGEDGSVAVKLMDFGIACQEAGSGDQLTRLDSRGPGTPVYMAPERIDPEKFGQAGPATDLYAVGVILYEMLAGHPPFRGAISEVFHGHLSRPPDLSALEPAAAGLADVVARALAKEPGDRFPDADAFRRALAGTPRGGGEEETRPAGAASEPTLLQCDPDGDEPEGHTLADPVLPAAAAGHHRRLVGVVAAGLGLLLVLAAFLLLHRQEEPAATGTPRTGAGPAAAASKKTGKKPATDGKGDRSALKELENRRGRGKSEAGKESGPGSASDWEIIEIRDRKIR